MVDEQLYHAGEYGPVVRRMGRAWQGKQVCLVVEPGNLRDAYGAVTHWSRGTIVTIVEDALTPVEEGAEDDEREI